MSIFKTTWFVIKIDKNNSIGNKKNWKPSEKWFIYTIFSYDYWKIKANKKVNTKEKQLDLWYIANFEIETKENKDIHKIKNVIIKSEFLSKKRSFNEINNYLLLLAIVNNKIPPWESISEVFDIIKTININDNIDDTKLILAKLRLLALIWELDTHHKNNTIIKILKFVNNNTFETLIKLKWINDDIKKELEQI